ncbi:MAG: hypothetical protein AB1689_08365 [Thermodesulfobacteriota bacterium]
MSRPLLLTAVVALLSAATTAAGADVPSASCPCSGPATGGPWRDHGQYVSCVTREARERARTTSLTARGARRAVRDSLRSSCGRRRPLEGNVRVCAANPVLPCPTVRTARVDACDACEAALAGRLVRCARVTRAAGGATDLCGAAATGRIVAGRVVDVRTGVDCASCKAKLGTPKAPGQDCVLAACPTSATPPGL